MNIVSAVHEGFSNVPKLFGSEVREQGKVTDFRSGMKEAGKARFHVTWNLRSTLTNCTRVSSTVIMMELPVLYVNPWKVPRKM